MWVARSGAAEYHSILGRDAPDDSKDHSASIFGAKQSNQSSGNTHPLPEGLISDGLNQSFYHSFVTSFSKPQQKRAQRQTVSLKLQVFSSSRRKVKTKWHLWHTQSRYVDICDVSAEVVSNVGLTCYEATFILQKHVSVY